MTIRVLIADDQEMVRTGFRMIVDSRPGMEVVRLVARGRTNEEIAGAPLVSLSTIKTHLGSIHRKLGVRNRVEVAAWAWESGLVR